MLKSGGLALLYKCGRHQLSTVAEVALRYFDNIKLILSGINEVWSLYLSAGNCCLLNAEVKKYCHFIDKDFSNSACHQERVIRQDTPYGSLDSIGATDIPMEFVQGVLQINRGFWASEDLERDFIQRLIGSQ